MFLYLPIDILTIFQYQLVVFITYLLDKIGTLPIRNSYILISKVIMFFSMYLYKINNINDM